MRSDERAALVIGGQGFIGRALVDRLKEQGKNYFYTGRGNGTNAHFLSSSAITDWRSVIEQLKISEIYITAGHYETSDDSSNWEKLWAANYSFPRDILEQIWELDVRVIVLGSYLQKDPETQGLWSFYTWSKECLRNYLRIQSEAASAKIIYVYLYDTYGENDVRPKIFNLLMNYKTENGTLNCGFKDQKINLTHVNDVVDGLIQATKIPMTEKFQEFQIRMPNSITLEELVGLVEKYRNCVIPIAYGNLQNRRQINNLWECANMIPEFVPKRSISEDLSVINIS